LVIQCVIQACTNYCKLIHFAVLSLHLYVWINGPHLFLLLHSLPSF